MPSPHKRNKRSPHRRKQRPTPLFFAGLLAVAALLAVTAFFTLRHHRQPAPPPAVVATTPEAPPPAPAHVPVHLNEEPPPVLPQPARPEPTVTPPPVVSTTTHRPRIALVIDDMGYHDKIGDALLELHLNLSFAFLPFAPYTQRQLELARHHHRDILLHLPMEATDPKWNPGAGALFVDMPAEELHHTVEEDLAAVPDAIGINNHMGSRFTEDEPAMRTFLSLLRPRHLFFLDSQTSAHSVGYHLAAELGIPALRRNVFLDNEQRKEKIKKQLDALIVLAKKQGIAIGIAHPHQETLDALRDFQRQPDPEVEMVAIHLLVHHPLMAKSKAQRTQPGEREGGR